MARYPLQHVVAASCLLSCINGETAARATGAADLYGGLSPLQTCPGHQQPQVAVAQVGCCSCWSLEKGPMLAVSQQLYQLRTATRNSA
jgi:hypothetical protein